MDDRRPPLRDRQITVLIWLQVITIVTICFGAWLITSLNLASASRAAYIYKQNDDQMIVLQRIEMNQRVFTEALVKIQTQRLDALQPPIK